jgi:ATP-dependent DNA helicase PIF1
LTPKNKDVNKINHFLLDKFLGVGQDVREYLSSDTAIAEETQLEYPAELFNAIEAGGIPYHKLKLKLGCPVILLRNLDPERGLCNGTRLIVRSFRRHIIEATIATGVFANTTALIPRITIIPTDNQSPVPFKRRQFPLRLAFCMTINKLQGQTLDRMGLFLPEPVFSHGQLYVALSRVKSSSSIKVLTADCTASMNDNRPADIYTDNVVYTEVFQ